MRALQEAPRGRRRHKNHQGSQRIQDIGREWQPCVLGEGIASLVRIQIGLSAKEETHECCEESCVGCDFSSMCDGCDLVEKTEKE